MQIPTNFPKLIDGVPYRIQTHKGLFIGYYNEKERRFERNGDWVTLEIVHDWFEQGKLFERWYEI